MRRLIYDCEIIRCIPSKNLQRILLNQNSIKFDDGFDYCAGWDDFENMGISTIGVCEVNSGETYAFVNPESNLGCPPIHQFEVFVKDAELSGFNNFSFDDNLCKANHINIKSTFDLLRLIRLSAYGSVSWEHQPRGYSYSLGAIAEANGYQKTGSGELAPKLWQQGAYEEVIAYCLNDVKITRQLLLLFEAGKLIDPNTGLILSYTAE